MLRKADGALVSAQLVSLCNLFLHSLCDAVFTETPHGKHRCGRGSGRRFFLSSRWWRTVQKKAIPKQNVLWVRFYIKNKNKKQPKAFTVKLQGLPLCLVTPDVHKPLGAGERAGICSSLRKLHVFRNLWYDMGGDLWGLCHFVLCQH